MTLIVRKRWVSRRHLLGEKYDSGREEGELPDGMSPEGIMDLVVRK